MLDQSFSIKNFRDIFDIENRKGNYLEGKFFPEVEKVTNKIQKCRKKYRQYVKEGNEKQKQEVTINLEELKLQKERLLIEVLSEVSNTVTSGEFSFDLNRVDIGNDKSLFVANETAPTFFSLKQLQYNIHRLYKVKQENRHKIICQLRELLSDKFPKQIFRTDISSFYESIPWEKLWRRLRDDSLLTPASKKIIWKILSEYSQLTMKNVGLPRGIGISAYLAELYMRDIDSAIREYPGVVYYARYVDDFFIIYCPPPNSGISDFQIPFRNELHKLGLKINKNKTKTILVGSKDPDPIEYLGYKFEIKSDKVILKMSDNKIKKYKKRLDLAFMAHEKQSLRSIKKARALLERRVRFLTGNTRLVNNKKNIVTGIFFSNPLLTNPDDLTYLDDYLNTKIATLESSRLKNRISRYSFVDGFRQRIYYKFSAQELSQIVEAWKHAS